ncbi:hypothetical protein BGZ98_003062 [Dissophora globulifera]|nr:hypothetical protein BGZ98_003062 [Dissophora globulifera]
MSEVKEPPPKPSRIRTATSSSAKSSLTGPAAISPGGGQHSPVAKSPVVFPRALGPRIPAKATSINFPANSSEQLGAGTFATRDDGLAPATADATVTARNSAHQASYDLAVLSKAPAPLPTRTGHANKHIPAAAAGSHNILPRTSPAPAPPPKPKRISLAPQPKAKPLSLQAFPFHNKVETPVRSTTLPASVPLTSATPSTTTTTTIAVSGAPTIATGGASPARLATPNSTLHACTTVPDETKQALGTLLNSGPAVSPSPTQSPLPLQPPVKKPRSAEHSTADESVVPIDTLTAQQRFHYQMRVQSSSPPPSMSMSNPSIGSKPMIPPSTLEKSLEFSSPTSPTAGTNPTLVGARSRLRSTSDAKASVSLAVAVPLYHPTRTLATSYSNGNSGKVSSIMDEGGTKGFDFLDDKSYSGALASPTYQSPPRHGRSGAETGTYEGDYIEEGSSGGQTSEKLAVSLHKIQALAQEQTERMKQISYADKRADIADVVYEKSSIWRARGAEWGGIAKKAWDDRGGMGGIAGGLADRWKKRGDGMHDGTSNYSRPGVSTIFGIPLEEAVRISKISASTGVPAIVTRCIEYLDVMGVEEIGLYRVSGSTSNVARLKAIFDGGLDYDFLQKGNEPQNPHDVATLLKLYLRELPSPIIPANMMPTFNSIDFSNSGQQSLKQLQDALHGLQLENYILLGTLCQHLSNLADYEHCTRMNISNLGLIFCPTLQIGSVLFKNLLGGDGGEDERRKSLLAVWKDLERRHEELENLEMIRDFEMGMQFENNGDRAFKDEATREHERDRDREQPRAKEVASGRHSWEEVDRDLLDFSQSPPLQQSVLSSPFSSPASHVKAGSRQGGVFISASPLLTAATTQSATARAVRPIEQPLDLYDELMAKELNEATTTPLIDFSDDDDKPDQQSDRRWRKHAREPATNRHSETPPRGIAGHERVPVS